MRSLGALYKLDWISVWIGHPGDTERAQKVMGRAKRWCTTASQMDICAVCIVGPEYDLYRAPAEVGPKAMVRDCRVDGCYSYCELVQLQFHVVWIALLGRSERLPKTDFLIETD